MKKFIILLSLVCMFACNNQDTKTETLKLDTSSLYNSNALTDSGTFIQTTSTRRGSRILEPKYPRTARKSNYGTTQKPNYSTTATQPVQQKKGWSKAAKGAVIGGVGGAVTGAIISKKKGKGAIIGGVIGAAGGYIIGRKKDKKEGR